MSILEQYLANGGNVQLALEEHELLELIGGEPEVDVATELALAQAKADSTPDPVATTADDVLTVSTELEKETEGCGDAEALVDSLEAVGHALKRAQTTLDFAIAYECYNGLRAMAHLPTAPKLSVECLDHDLEGERKLALEGLSDLKAKVMGLLDGAVERMAKLLGKSGETVSKAGAAQEVRSKALMSKLFGLRSWNATAEVTVPANGLERFGKAASNPHDFSGAAVSVIAALFDGGSCCWAEFTDSYLKWVREGGSNSDPDNFETYKIPEKITAKLPLRPRIEDGKVVFDKPEPVKGVVVVPVGDKNNIKSLLSNTQVISKIMAEMDKYFGNFEEHYRRVKSAIEAYVEKRSKEDEYFKNRKAEDYREILRRIEANVAFFVAMAGYMTEINKFLLDFATAAVAAGEKG